MPSVHLQRKHSAFSSRIKGHRTCQEVDELTLSTNGQRQTSCCGEELQALLPQHAATTDITATLSTNHNAQDPSCRKKKTNKDADKDKRHAAVLTMA
jgi:hypothetical protein